MKKAPAIKVTVLLISALGASYGLGYLQGTGNSQALALLGRLSLGAILFLILGVLAKIIVAALLRRSGGKSPGPGDSGNGPRPPRAPVPRPGGGRPPTLSAAVDLKAGTNA